MFKLVTIQLTEPICLCLEQRLGWNVKNTEAGASLHIWCQLCETRVVVPAKQFLANFQFDTPYPGKLAQKIIQRPDVQAGDVVDFVEYLKRRRQTPPS